MLLISAILPEAFLLRFLSKGKPFIVAHLIAYACLAALICFALRFQRKFLSLKMSDGLIWILAWGLAVAWGGIIEVSQLFIRDRYADWLDVYTNAAGALAGILCYVIVKAFLRRILCKPKSVTAQY